MASIIDLVDDFKVTGRDLVNCIANYLDTRPEEKGRKTIEAFRSGAIMLHRCLCAYYAETSSDPAVARHFEESMGSIPNILKLSQFVKKRAKDHEAHASKNYHNRMSPEGYDKRYTLKQFHQMNVNFLTKDITRNTAFGEKKAINEAVNVRTEIQLGHHGLLRGDNKRTLEWADIMYCDAESGRGSVSVMLVKLTHSKTRTAGSPATYTGFIRHKEPEMCVVNALSFSLWYRFDFDFLHAPNAGEHLPNFLDKTEWYNIKTLFANAKRHSKDHHAICYNKEHELAAMALESIGLHSSIVTHQGRKSGPQIAEAYGVMKSAITLAGGWANSVYERSYGLPISFEYMHVSAGFLQDESYRIARDVEVPENIQKQIFPWLDALEKKINSRTDQVGKKWHERDDQIGFFIELLKKLRVTIPQDAAILSSRYPSSFYWKHPMIQSAPFKKFRDEVLMKIKRHNATYFYDTSEDVQRLSEAIIVQLRAIKHGLDRGFNQNSRDIAKLGSHFDEKMTSMMRSVGELQVTQETTQIQGQRYFEDMFVSQANQGDKLNQLHAEVNQMHAELRELKGDVGVIAGILQRLDIKNRSSTEIDSSDEPDLTATGLRPPQAQVDDEEFQKLSQMPLLPTPENIGMEKSIQTVPHLVQMWDEGRGQLYSYNMRVKKWNLSWLKADTNYYNRMKKIIVFIEEALVFIHEDEPLRRKEIGEILEEYRKRRDLSLSQLCRIRKQDVSEGMRALFLEKEIRFAEVFDN